MSASHNASHALSKSRVMRGLQCHKALWLGTHRKDVARPVTPEQQAVFDQGTRVGELARERFPGGLLIDAPCWNPDQAVQQTRAAIDAGATVLYEPAFVHESVTVRVDVLHRERPAAAWHLVEVKSSTSVKDVHVPDVAVQAWVLAGCGEPVDACHLMHINRECEHPHLEQLFIIEDVTSLVEPVLGGMSDIVAELAGVIGRNEAPAIDIGPHCAKPYECSFREHCWKENSVPDWSVFDVRSLRSKQRWALYHDGVISSRDVLARLRQEGLGADTPAGRSAEALVTGHRFIDPEALCEALADWSYPRLFLDFETLGGAVPPFPGTRPYPMVPFQYSAHVLRGPTAELEHFEYLHPDDSDPRPVLSATLAGLARDVFDSHGDDPGCVVAYNSGFERGCLERLAESSPDHGPELLDLAHRLVDPLPILRAAVYDRAFRTSYSLKAVAPALLGSDAAYSGMDVDSGPVAQLAFAEMIDPRCSPERRSELEAALLAYCCQDTAVLVKLVQWMEGEGGLTP